MFVKRIQMCYDIFYVLINNTHINAKMNKTKKKKFMDFK